MAGLAKKIVRTSKATVNQVTKRSSQWWRSFETLTKNLPGTLGRSARWCWARRNGARLILVTSLAAGLTWAGASTLGIGAPVTAAVAATLTVQAAVASSLRGGVSRVMATLTAVAIALAVFELGGIHAWSIAVVVGTSLIAGRLLGLGPEGSLQVPATSLGIFVIGNGLDAKLVEDRVSATLFGVVAGVLLSSFAHRSSVAQRALEQVRNINQEVSELLGMIAAGIGKQVEPAAAIAWLQKSRDIQHRFEAVKPMVQAALETARWGSRALKNEAAELALGARALEHSSEQLNSIARTLFDLTEQKALDLVPEELSGVLEKASMAFAVNAESPDPVQTDIAETPLEAAIDEIKDERENALGAVRDIDDTAVWLVSGSIISSVDRMVESLDQSAPALKVGQYVEPEPLINVPIPRRRSIKLRNLK